MLSRNASTVLGYLSSSGVRTSAELSSLTKLSQPSVSRALNELARANPLFFTYKAGRTAYYAILRQIGALPVRIPVFREGSQYGELVALEGGGFVFSGPAGARHSDGLPWFMQDLRPQGYIGRSFCHTHAGELGVPARLLDWTDWDVLRAVASDGYDAPGGISILRPASLSIPEIELEKIPDYYDRLATASMEGAQPGSSAGGEHPKFAISYLAGGMPRHVMVKFSPPLDNHVALRWKDLLVAEHLANEILREHGFEAARTRIEMTGSRCHLEAERFDRRENGQGVCLASFASIDDEFIGRRKSWADSAAALCNAGMLAPEFVGRIQVLEAFGRLIGNTDMHFGNLSFFWYENDGAPFFEPAPIYDMLPMLYAPSRGEVITPEFSPAEEDDEARDLAGEFWRAVADHEMVSREFSEIASENVTLVASYPGHHL